MRDDIRYVDGVANALEQTTLTEILMSKVLME